MTSNSAIRKAAILINTLDSVSGDALLEQMGPNLAARVRSAVMDLDEIPADEQRRVIGEFLRGQNASFATRAAVAGGVELDASLLERIEKSPALENPLPPPAIPAAVTRSRPAVASAATHQSQPRFAFLNKIAPAALAEFLEREHPQMAAVVIAHLPPEQAAAILERMPADLSTEALRRMAWIDSMAPEVLADLERELRALFPPPSRIAENRQSGLANVGAVLSAFCGSRRSEVLQRLSSQDASLVRQLGYIPAAREPAIEALETTGSPITFRRHTDESTVEDQQASLSAAREGYVREGAPEHLEFHDFPALPNDVLKRIFAAADPQVALLALTGADETLVLRILRQLSPTDAQALRRRLNHPGPIRLRDIEAAQRQLAQLAGELAAAGEINIPQQRGFAAAA